MSKIKYKYEEMYIKNLFSEETLAKGECYYNGFAKIEIADDMNL